MADFTSQFKRLSGTSKRYIDLSTGGEVSYRQARNRFAASGNVRKAVAPARQAKATKGVQDFYKVRKGFLEKEGATYKELRSNANLANREKIEQDIQRRIKNKTSFKKRRPKWAEDEDGNVDYAYAREVYGERTAVGGFWVVR
jgi:hypothetical protein